MHTILKNTFGYDAFRAGQEEPIQCLLQGQNVFCVMPTGAGKSIIYQIPALMGEGLSIVISPLIALMQDQISALQMLGVNAATLNSTNSDDERQEIWDGIKNGAVRLLYLSPEKLMMGNMLEILKHYPIKLIAIDEAHCISQWGPSFRPEYEMLMGLKQHFPNVPIAALTASADEATRNDIIAKLFKGDVNTFISGFDRPNISLNVEPKANWKQQLIDYVHQKQNQSGIVYCLSRKKTEAAAAALNQAGFPALAYHAGMDKDVRARNQTRFVKEDNLIMCATIAFGMGIDKPDVRFVFHTDLPSSMETYYQEFGRGGRDGDPADAYMLYGLDDIRMRRMFIAQGRTSDAEQKRREYQRLDTLIAYCETPNCRRQSLLAYFSDSCEPCNNCDACNNPSETQEGTREGQMALSAILRTGQKFGQTHIIDVLVGANTARIRQFAHEELPTWGVGKAHSKPQWRSIIRQLVSAGFIHLDTSEFGGLSMTAKGKALLKGENNFSYHPTRLKAKSENKSRKQLSPETDLEPHQLDVFERLKSLRNTLARQSNVPAYIIFNNKSLRDMVEKTPQTLEDFADVHGVGQAKIKKFGEIFLKEINT
ncbi:MAG: DNA helicase RecQ [Robiginitomaculum sp.]|nr:MAG: DNA helicase RecQ [Robiginitomaculum sp.]